MLGSPACRNYRYTIVMSLFRLMSSVSILAVLLTAAGCGGSSPTSPSSDVSYAQVDLVVGTGAEATAGKSATVEYTGWLYSATATDNKGARFDSGTFAFTLGAGTVIRGFDQGVTGMRVGGTRRVVIPPSLGYGTSGSGVIPPNAALVFEIALTSIL